MRRFPRTARRARLRASALATLLLLGCGARTSLSESAGVPATDGGEPLVAHDAGGPGASRGAADGEAHASDAGTVDAGTGDAGTGDADLGPGDASACGSGERTLASTGQNQPTGLAIDANNVYWTDGESVRKVPLCGGKPTLLASDSATFGAGALAVDSGHLYWLTSSYAADGGASESTVVKMRISGGAPITLAAAQAPSWLVVDSTSAYWTDIGVDDSDCTVMKVPITGGAATTLVSGQVSPDGIGGLALDAAYVYWTTGGPATATNGGAVVKAPIGGGAPTTLATGQYPGALAVDDTHVYWVNTLCAPPNDGGAECTENAIVSVPLGGGAPTTLASGEGQGEQIALDAVNVYWTTSSRDNSQFGMGPVLVVPKAGGTPATLASGQYDPTGIAVNENSAVWLSAGLSNAQGTVTGASVMEVTPK